MGQKICCFTTFASLNVLGVLVRRHGIFRVSVVGVVQNETCGVCSTEATRVVCVHSKKVNGLDVRVVGRTNLMGGFLLCFCLCPAGLLEGSTAAHRLDAPYMIEMYVSYHACLMRRWLCISF